MHICCFDVPYLLVVVQDFFSSSSLCVCMYSCVCVFISDVCGMCVMCAMCMILVIYAIILLYNLPTH